MNHTSHRPYPLPSGRPSWRQEWLDLAFFHWRVPKELIEVVLPDGLELDLFEGEAWVSVVPFRMEGVMLRGLPNIPGVSNFPELNLRTYVIRDGKPGVWFYSLDADQAIAVWAARTFFHLPYIKATMRSSLEGEAVRYTSLRDNGTGKFEAMYRPMGEVRHAVAGTLEYFLSERYCLYAFDGTSLFCGDIHHRPWPLQGVDYSIESNQVASEYGVPIGLNPDLAHFSKRIEVAVWGLQRC
ncbi:YqjF family protein [Rubritalea sp.]|uniref:YqjF family protein n=1 Tax=Rubritalea sp. TaxID=2109375 RepID=UPI003EF27D48